MRSLTVLLVTLVGSLCVSCEPIPPLNKDKTKSSIATISFEKQLEETDVQQFNAEIKNVPKLHLEDGLKELVEESAAYLADNESLKKRATRQLAVTASFPYTFYPYIYYPTVYPASVNYYRATIFPFLGI